MLDVPSPSRAGASFPTANTLQGGASVRPALGRLGDGTLVDVVHGVRVTGLGEGLEVLGHTLRDRPAAVELGIDLGAEQDREVRQPEPDEEHDDAGQ